MDKDFMSDPFKKSNYDNPTKNHVAPPCATCPMMKDCEVSGKECKAFKGWTNNGKHYQVEHIGKGI